MPAGTQSHCLCSNCVVLCDDRIWLGSWVLRGGLHTHRTHTHTCRHTHTYTHADTHMQTHTHTHTHTHTVVLCDDRIWMGSWVPRGGETSMCSFTPRREYTPWCASSHT